MSHLYYIIEHPTRGTLLWESEIGEPHFSPTNLRGDERNWKFLSLTEALRILNKYVTTEKLRTACYVLRSNDWNQVYPTS